MKGLRVPDVCGNVDIISSGLVTKCKLKFVNQIIVIHNSYFIICGPNDWKKIYRR